MRKLSKKTANQDPGRDRMWNIIGTLFPIHPDRTAEVVNELSNDILQYSKDE